MSGHKNITRQTPIDNSHSPGRPLIIVRRLGEIFVEVGVLCESKTSLVLDSEMDKVLKDLWQIRCIGTVTECLGTGVRYYEHDVEKLHSRCAMTGLSQGSEFRM